MCVCVCLGVWWGGGGIGGCVCVVYVLSSEVNVRGEMCVWVGGGWGEYRSVIVSFVLYM